MLRLAKQKDLLVRAPWKTDLSIAPITNFYVFANVFLGNSSKFPRAESELANFSAHVDILANIFWGLSSIWQVDLKTTLFTRLLVKYLFINKQQGQDWS